METKDQHQFLREVLNDDIGAILLCETMFGISQTWDDLVDGDNPVDSAQVNLMMWRALVELPGNPFYVKNIDRLQPIIKMSIIDWLTANGFEAAKEDNDLAISFVIRDSLTYLVIACAEIVRGPSDAIILSPAIRRFFHDESFAEYMKGLSDERQVTES